MKGEMGRPGETAAPGINGRDGEPGREGDYSKTSKIQTLIFRNQESPCH